MPKELSFETSWKLLLSGLGIFIPLVSVFLTYLVVSIHNLELKTNVLSSGSYPVSDAYNLDRIVSVLKERTAAKAREVDVNKQIIADHERRIKRLEERGK